MNLTPQHKKILDIFRDCRWHCSTEIEYIRDARKRISELNYGYLREKGYRIIGKKCDKRCGTNHSSGLFMRKAEKIPEPKAILSNFPYQAPFAYKDD